MSNGLSRRDLITLATMTMLSPALRLFPSAAIRLAGRTAWLSALAGIPLMLLYAWLISRMMDSASDGEGMQDLFLRLPGKFTGKAFLLISGMWFTLYAGFVLRSGADRLVVTVYPGTAPWGFALSMGLLCALAAMGSIRTVARVGRIVRPVVLGALGLIVVFALFDIRKDNVLPVALYNVLPTAEGALPAVDILALGTVSVCFFQGASSKTPGRMRDAFLWVIYFSVLLGLTALIIVGSFGAEVAGLTSAPFFVLVRNLVFFRTVERVEALVVALWIFPDFLLVSSMLLAAHSCLRLALGFSGSISGGKVFDMSDGRFMIWLCAAVAAAAGILIAPDSRSLELWSEQIIPYSNMFYCFILIPTAAFLLRRGRNDPA